MKKTTLAFATILFASPAVLQATTYEWNRDSGSGSWANSANWSPDDAIPGVGDEVIVNKNSVSIVLNGDRNIAIWRSGWGDSADALNNTVTLRAGTSGSSLTIGTAEQGGLMVVGGAITAPALTSALIIDSQLSVNLVGGSLIMGSDILSGSPEPSRSKNRSGTIRMNVDSELNIGTLDHRSQMHVGRQTATGPTTTSYNAVSSGTLMANTTSGGGHLNAFTSDLEVGVSTGAPYMITTHKADGMIDLKGMQSARIDTLNLLVGSGSSASAKGVIDFGTHNSADYSLIARRKVQIGVGGESATSTPTQQDNNVSGELTWGNGVSVAIGSEAQRAEMEIGVSAITRGSNISVSGNVTASGGKFSGHFSTLIIGSQNAVDGSKQFTAQGVLDLREANVTHFSVSENATIGHGQGVGSKGSLYLANTAAAIAQNLTIGSNAPETGLVNLRNTVVDVDGNLTINAGGIVEVTIDGRSSGISLSGTSSLSIDLAGNSSVGYRITFNSFEESEPLVHGFAWAGNRVDELQSFVQQQKISWTNANPLSEVGIFYDLSTDTTYIGFKAIPEPGSVGMISLGLIVFGSILKARHRR